MVYPTSNPLLSSILNTKGAQSICTLFSKAKGHKKPQFRAENILRQCVLAQDPQVPALQNLQRRFCRCFCLNLEIGRYCCYHHLHHYQHINTKFLFLFQFFSLTGLWKIQLTVLRIDDTSKLIMQLQT